VKKVITTARLSVIQILFIIKTNMSNDKNKKNNKRSRAAGGVTLFDAVEALTAQDAQAAQQPPVQHARQVRQCRAAQSQTKIYSSLMECRILLQRAATGVAAVSTEVEDDEEGEAGERAKADAQCENLLTQLRQARQKLVFSSSATNSDEAAKASSDEVDMNAALQSEYEKCREEWKQVLDSRHRSVQLHAGAGLRSMTKFGAGAGGNSNSVINASFWQQVEATVQHEQLRRQRLENNEDQTQQPQALFDDSKVYQQMLKDFVATSTVLSNGGGVKDGDGIDAVQARLRSKQSSSKKPDVDRRASKGRKIRYTPLPKLANFTFPQSRRHRTVASSFTTTTLNLDEDEWFRSLFGGVGANRAQQETSVE